MAKKKKCPPPGAPMWVLTFGDCMTLLLCFFVLLFSFSTMDIAKFEKLIASFQGAFSVLKGGEAISSGMLKKAKSTEQTKKFSDVVEEIKEEDEKELDKMNKLQSEINDIKQQEQDQSSLEKLREINMDVTAVKAQVQQRTDQLNKNRFEIEKVIKERKFEQETVHKIQRVIDDIIRDKGTDKKLSEYQQLKHSAEKLSEHIEKSVTELFKKEKAEIREMLKELALIKKELEEKNINIDFRMDREKGLIITISDRALFDSGNDTWRKESTETLNKIAEVLKKNKRMLSIEGHTDNVPVGPSLRKKFPTNWELSTSRATKVLRYLVEKQQIKPERISAAGYGEYRPVDSNDTEAGRAKNRRVDIVVLNTEKINFNFYKTDNENK